MMRLTIKDFPQQLLEYYDYYTHGKTSKHKFLQLVGKYTVGGITVLALFNLLKPDYALTEQILSINPDIRPEYIHYPPPNDHGEVRACPMASVKIVSEAPAVIVVHEGQGFSPYIEDVAQWAVKTGYIVLAPDGLSVVGGYPGNDNEGRMLQQEVDPVKLVNDFFAVVAFMARCPQVMREVGIARPCYNDGIGNAAAAVIPELACAASFCGCQPSLKEVGKIKTPLPLYYTSPDSDISEGWPAYERALKKYHKVHEAYLYQGVSHGFHNDSTPCYGRAAVDLVW